jgi:hypothetical protein
MSVHAHKSMHNCTYANIPAYRNKHNTCSLSETTLKITTKNNQVGNNNHETDQKKLGEMCQGSDSKAGRMQKTSV